MKKHEMLPDTTKMPNEDFDNSNNIIGIDVGDNHHHILNQKAGPQNT